jgi:Ni/Fe-hydrogenase subunit HybB-like protein
MNRVRNFKLFLWSLIGLGAAVATARFMFGLGATTNLSDAVPWGLWIGFDVMSGVALAAGGFVLTATVYIFRLEKFHGIVRAAVLTAFLGYVAVAVGLLFDLGLPWNIWHMIVFWNPHSPLFEVGWCVMLYLTVLLLEFLPVPAESFSSLARVRTLLVRLRLPLVIAGISLSTLHQSSLGSLFLIMPSHVHPLWYSPLLPVIFFLSAIALGLMMVTLEGLITSYLYRRPPETELLAKLGRAARWIFLIYLGVRFTDLVVRGQLEHLSEGVWQVKMFWVEIALSAVIPSILLFISKVRNTLTGLWIVAPTAVVGIVLNRINVGGLVHQQRGETLYLPAWTEIIISAAIVAGAALAFLYMVEKFHVWERHPVDPEAQPKAMPAFDIASFASLGSPQIRSRTVYSLAFIFAAALGFSLLSQNALSSRGMDPAPVGKARGWNEMWIDGNLDGFGTSFAHQKHFARGGGDSTSCAICHHANLPHDRFTGCYQCHRDMYSATDAFRHNWHASPAGAALRCFDCHRLGEVKSAATAKSCSQCHQDLKPSGVVIAVKNNQAASYTEAMHGLCLGCHKEQAAALNKADLARCGNCHRERKPLVDDPVLAKRYEVLESKGVIVPKVSEPRFPGFPVPTPPESQMSLQDRP